MRIDGYATAWRGPRTAGTGALGAFETLLWGVLLAATILLRTQIAGGPELANDSYQYLSVAGHWLSGGPAVTSIVHFDAERTHGRIPAPLTTFPAGYPLLVALVSAAGPPPAQAALVVSLLGALALAAVLSRAAVLLGTPASVTRALLALLATSSTLLVSGNNVASELPFAALSCGALLLLIAAETGPCSAQRYLSLQLGGAALIAAAFYLRYAGLFLLAAVGAFYAGRWLATRSPRAGQALAALSLASVLVGAALWRNYVLVGTWKGGNEKAVENPIPELLYTFARTMHHLFLGDGPARLGPAEVVLALGLAFIVAAGARALWSRRGALITDPRMQLLAAYIAVYVGAMLYLGARSVISFGPRMFVPLLPVLLLFAAGICAHASPALPSPAGRRRILLGAVALVGAYTAINLAVLLEGPGTMPHERVRARLETTLADGTSLRERIEREVPADAILVASDGQASAHVLGRKVLSLVSPHFSAVRWTEDVLREEMARFGARHVLVYYGNGQADAVVRSTAFLSGLAAGRSPGWLRLLADNGRAKLYGVVP